MSHIEPATHPRRAAFNQTIATEIDAVVARFQGRRCDGDELRAALYQLTNTTNEAMRQMLLDSIQEQIDADSRDAVIDWLGARWGWVRAWWGRRRG